MLLLLAFLLLARDAHADEGYWQVDLGMAARYAGNLEAFDDGADARVHQTSGRVDLRGLWGLHHVGVAAGMDVELGFEVPGGFVYGFHLLPLGRVVRLWGRAALGVMTGAGLGGVVDRVPFAWELPLHGFVEVDLGSHVRLLGTARATYTPGTGSREDGAVDASWTDEAELGQGLAFGGRHLDYDSVWSDGTYVGVFAREQLGGQLVGLVLSVNLNAASSQESKY